MVYDKRIPYFVMAVSEGITINSEADFVSFGSEGTEDIKIFEDSLNEGM